MSVRKQLLAVWVQCKQLLHQPITPGSYDITEVNCISSIYLMILFLHP